jgi:hypothetical protein
MKRGDDRVWIGSLREFIQNNPAADILICQANIILKPALRPVAAGWTKRHQRAGEYTHLRQYAQTCALPWNYIFSKMSRSMARRLPKNIIKYTKTPLRRVVHYHGALNQIIQLNI